MTERVYTAIVLAAQRPGVTNQVAETFGQSHKCLVPINGRPMLERVLENLVKAPEVGNIIVSIEDPEIALKLPYVKALTDAGTLSFAQSERTLADSLAAAMDQAGNDAMPFFITAADNCFHTDEIVSFFLQGVSKTGADAAWAMARDELIQQTYPGTGKITGRHKLRDGIWSNCNIYAICSPDAKLTVEMFRGGGQFGNNKKKKALIPVVGLWSFFLYRYGLVTLEGLAKQASKVFKINAQAVEMPFADAPIDADDMPSFNFIEAHLKEREGDKG